MNEGQVAATPGGAAVAETVEALRGRARDFALASMASAYPDEELLQTVAALSSQLSKYAALAPLLERLHVEGVDAARSAWIARFDEGKARVSLYETEYGRMRGMSKGRDLADLSGFYRAFGLELDEAMHEMLDHLPIELEFYALLLAKEAYLGELPDGEGVEVVADARRKFLDEHLGSFPAAVAARVVDDAVYGPVLAWCAALVAQECRALALTPAPLDPFVDPSMRAEDEGELKCGSLPVLPS